MKKFNWKKKISIILVNIILIVLTFFLCEFLVYKIYESGLLEQSKDEHDYKYQLITSNQIVNAQKKKIKTELRKIPILKKNDTGFFLLFGCSFAYGFGLQNNQTVAYKLSEILKIPIVNRGINGGTIQQMYFQLAAEGNEDFYKNIPVRFTNNIMYILTQDHYQRLYNLHFKRRGTLANYRYLNYFDKQENLKTTNQRSLFESLLRTSYIYKHLNRFYCTRFVSNPKNKNKILNRTAKYFIASKEAIEKQKGSKVNFIVLFYDKIQYEEELEQKLKENGIYVIKTKDLTKEDLKSLKYTLSETDKHPNEAAWDLLTPLIAKEIKKIWAQNP